MATLLSLRRRIKSAQNISKTTRAMQMISASKLRKAQEAALAARPYVEKLTSIAKNLAPANPETNSDILHPYMRVNGSKNTLYILIAPDKGLCGGLVTNLVREYFKYQDDNNSFFITVGKRIEGTVASTNKHLLAAFPFGINLPSFNMVGPITKLINEQYLEGHVGSVYILTTHFTSIFSQTPRLTKLLPITLPTDGSIAIKSTERIYEPSEKDLLPPLLTRYLDMEIFHTLLESYASEQAARMIAMQNATDNAKDIVSALTLLYNKARQNRITSEILDITSASVALEDNG